MEKRKIEKMKIENRNKNEWKEKKNIRTKMSQKRNK